MPARIRTRGQGAWLAFSEKTGQIMLADGTPGSPDNLACREAVEFCIDELLKRGAVTEFEACGLRHDAEIAQLPSLSELTAHTISHAVGMASTTPKDEPDPDWGSHVFFQ